MDEMSSMILQQEGYQKQYDFTQYSHDNNVNVIPEQDFHRLVAETFKCIADILRNTYGPYASSVMISDQSETFATKDGYNAFNAVGFSHTYKRMVYLAIKKIIDRVNDNVGDGTTSCILLAEKLFNELEKILKTVDDKRNIMSVLNNIEHHLLDREQIEVDIDDGPIGKLTIDALEGLINMAGNYDPKLTAIIRDALDPVSDQGVVSSVRNVVVESKLDRDGDSTKYDIDYLPGDYRVRVKMDAEIGLTFEEPRKIRVAVYDHVFGPSDWNFFMHNYDKQTETLIIARGFQRTFMDHEYVQYCKNLMLVKAFPTVYLVEIKGDFVQNEIKDLCAMLQTEPIGLHAKAVDHENLPAIPVQVYKGNCMCFFLDGYTPDKYIELLKAESDADLSDSLCKHQDYINRIKALSCTSKDTMITVNANSSLELKLVTDKIDDCIAIVNSALNYGIVPNLFAYGYWRMDTFKECVMESDQDAILTCDAADAIMTALKGLFNDIWKSKHGNEFLEKRDQIAKQLYASPTYSFDIIKESFVSSDVLPTSAQYDLEVIAAAISIVKYLLTSCALIFDAFIMKPVDDTGSYKPIA